VPSPLSTARGCCHRRPYIDKGYSYGQRNYLPRLAVDENTYLHSENYHCDCPKFENLANHNVPLPLSTARVWFSWPPYIGKGYFYGQRNYLLVLAVDVYAYLHSKITIVDCPKFENLADHNVPLPLLAARGCCPWPPYIGKGNSCGQRNYLLPLVVKENTYWHSKSTIITKVIL
jgi:hypothetical protein